MERERGIFAPHTLGQKETECIFWIQRRSEMGGSADDILSISSAVLYGDSGNGDEATERAQDTESE